MSECEGREGTADLDADSISLLTSDILVLTKVEVQVAPCIPSPSARIEWFPAFASSHGHGVHVIRFLGAFDFADVKAKGVAHSRRPVVGVPEAGAADRVPLTTIKHLWDEGLPPHDFLAVVGANYCNRGGMHEWISIKGKKTKVNIELLL